MFEFGTRQRFAAATPLLAMVLWLDTIALATPQSKPSTTSQPNAPAVDPLRTGAAEELISFTLHPGMFAPNRRTTAEVISSANVDKSREIISRAMSKYPECVLLDNIERVYVTSRLKDSEGVELGGTYWEKRMYLCYRGNGDSGNGDAHLEESFHHEFSSILRATYRQHFPDTEWLTANPPSFSYLGSGNQAMKENKASELRVRSLMQLGFVCQYAQSDAENDFNCTASDLFLNRPGFWECVQECPQLARKVDLAIKFYSRVDPTFTETYFRNLPHCGRPVFNDDRATTQPASTEPVAQAGGSESVGLYTNDQIEVMTAEQARAALAEVAHARAGIDADSERGQRLKREFELLVGRIRIFKRVEDASAPQ